MLAKLSAYAATVRIFQNRRLRGVAGHDIDSTLILLPPLRVNLGFFPSPCLLCHG
jgi:hypothetical protein